MIDVPGKSAIKSESPGSFRDRLATVDKSGKRNWIFAKKPKGRFYRSRTIVSWTFFLLFIGLPFIEINGRPLFLFNIPEGRFIIFSKVFWPQDFFIFGLTMITFVVFIVLFTAAFGRLFCGWVCPQTNFMEMLFRKVEYLIEGDANAQRRLSKAPWTFSKIARKVSKHGTFFLLSFLIANLFLSYIIGIKELKQIITGPFSLHVGGFSAIMLFSGIFYGVYAYFREQICTVICPYGRLQGVLLDRNSLIVAYDYKRGEPRGKLEKTVEQHNGDCIDCYSCVTVCPTGIDIRDGTQMECVNCTACIDACDSIMDKINRPRGLIRYASENNIAEGKPLKFTARMKFYVVLLILLSGLLSALLITRKDIDVTVMRTPGILYQERGTDSISNLYNVKILNKTMKAIPVIFKLEDNDGIIQVIGHQTIVIKEEGQGSGSFFVVLPKKSIKERISTIHIGLYEGKTKISTMKSNFFGPVN
ncbi:MAG: cytochrome c oxidase accessory protein CcoG [Chitinophagaceae bacterium]